MYSDSPSSYRFFCFFFFNDTATTEIYTLSLHDALPIWRGAPVQAANRGVVALVADLYLSGTTVLIDQDRKSTRLNSSHGYISYAVFCLKKKKQIETRSHLTNRLISITHRRDLYGSVLAG